MRTITSYLRLIRIENVLFTAIAVLAGGWIAVPGVLPQLLWLGAISASLIAAGANAYNDYCDIRPDNINHPNRPLVVGTIGTHTALTSFIVLTSIGCLLGTLLPGWSFTIPVVVAGLLFAYNRWLKREPMIGNFVVAICGGMAPVFGAVVVGNSEIGMIPGVLAFVGFSMREMAKDAQDIPGDTIAGYNTSAMTKQFLRFKIQFWVLGILLLYGLYHVYRDQNFGGDLYRIFFDLTSMIVLVTLGYSFQWKQTETIRSSRLSLLSKMILVTGLIMLVLGRSGV